MWLTVFANHSDHFGMDTSYCYFLGGIPIIYLLYDGCIINKQLYLESKYLKWIAFANIGYGILSIVLLLINFERVDLLLQLYMIGEVLVLFILSYIELFIASRNA